MKFRHYAILLLHIFLCNACGLYRHYERPSLDYNEQQLCIQDSLSEPISALSWRELFTDSCLVRWIESALSGNTDLRIAQLKVKEAEATLTASRLAFLPSLNVSADGSLSSKSSSSLTITPTASWELDVFGKQRNLKKGAEAAFYSSRSYQQAVQSSLISTIASSYYTLLMLDEQLSISERTLKTWDENIRALQALKRAGRTNEAAVLQARANRMQVENSATSLRYQIQVQENAVKSLLLNPDMDLSRGTIDAASFPDSLSSGITLELLSNRPDVKEAEYLLQQSFYNINVARAAFYPSVTLSGNVGWTTSSGNIGNPSSWLASALGSVFAPIFSKGTNTANLKIAKAEYEIAFIRFQKTLLDAGMEVNNALAAWQKANDRLSLDKKQIVALKGAVNTTRLLMRNTTTNYLEVLTAQQRLLEAELTEASDRYDAVQSIITLYNALGGGAN